MIITCCVGYLWGQIAVMRCIATLQRTVITERVKTNDLCGHVLEG